MQPAPGPDHSLEVELDREGESGCVNSMPTQGAGGTACRARCRPERRDSATGRKGRSDASLPPEEPGSCRPLLVCFPPLTRPRARQLAPHCSSLLPAHCPGPPPAQHRPAALSAPPQKGAVQRTTPAHTRSIISSSAVHSCRSVAPGHPARFRPAPRRRRPPRRATGRWAAARPG